MSRSLSTPPTEQLELPSLPRRPRCNPTWVVRGYLTEPRRSWTKARHRANDLGTLYVRAATEDRARAWAKSNRNPFSYKGWRRAKYVVVHQAHPVHDLGMTEWTRR